MSWVDIKFTLKPATLKMSTIELSIGLYWYVDDVVLENKHIIDRIVTLLQDSIELKLIKFELLDNSFKFGVVFLIYPLMLSLSDLVDSPNMNITFKSSSWFFDFVKQQTIQHVN